MQSPEAVSAVGKLSYNQLVEKIITCKHSSDTNLVTEGELPASLLWVLCGGDEGYFDLLFIVYLPRSAPNHIPLEREFGEHISPPSTVPGGLEVAVRQLFVE